jgi:hypothetical protein
MPEQLAERIQRSVALVSVLMLLAVFANTAKSVAPQLSSSVAAQGNAETKVWVNTNSGVYHCPGTHWYGSTKAGVYMKQSEAQQKGYRPAYHRTCQ